MERFCFVLFFSSRIWERFVRGKAGKLTGGDKDDLIGKAKENKELIPCFPQAPPGEQGLVQRGRGMTGKSWNGLEPGICPNIPQFLPFPPHHFISLGSVCVSLTTSQLLPQEKQERPVEVLYSNDQNIAILTKILQY